jgi:hypothetical protein
MGRRGVPLFSLCPGIRLKTEKNTENISQGRRAAIELFVAPTWLSFEGLPRLACCTSVHLCYSGDFSQTSVGTGAIRVAVLRGSRISKLRGETLGQCSHVDGEEWNPKS